MTPPAALAFDGASLSFQLDSRGQYVGAHPVDTKVFHLLRIQARSMRSAPATGNGVGGDYVDPLTIEAQVRDEVRLALADVVAAGDIADLGLTFDLSVRGRVMYRYDYQNLRTGKRGSFRSQ